MNGGKAKLPVVGDYVKYVYNPLGESLVCEVVEQKNVLKRPDQSGHAMGFVKTMLEQDIVGYAIALYAHDDVACKAFWQYGFGRRCIDLIRKLEPMGEIINEDLSFEELPLEEFPKLRNLRCELNNHLKQSPCFMQSTADEFETWADRVEEGNRRTFVAQDGDRIIAYLDIADEGETFITCRKEMVNIQGAYCRPEYRGRHVYDDLLEFVIETMMKEGYTLLGVDCESYNPNALHFWNKHFTEYTSSVTRRTENWVSKKKNNITCIPALLMYNKMM